MIPISDFSSNRLDQHWFTQHPVHNLRGDLCVFYSYAVAVSPVAKVVEQEVLDAIDAFVGSLQPSVIQRLGFLHTPSGYALIEAIHNRCVGKLFDTITRAAELRQMGNDYAQLETRLREARTTAILALSYHHGRAPHSIAIAYDASCDFFIRDSADPSGWGVLPLDATGTSIVQGVRNRDATAICGEAILFTEKVVPPPVNTP